MENKREIIQSVLKRLDFVNWDRYFGEKELTFFGWINRDKDNYKDFVTVTFDENGLIEGYATSSAEYTKRIANLLICYHLPCNRIEYFCDLPNIIKEKAKVSPSQKTGTNNRRTELNSEGDVTHSFQRPTRVPKEIKK